MINGIEGIPGSGKSYEAVVYHVLHYLRLGRKVITNLPLDVERFAAIDPGFRDLIELRTKSQKVLGTWDADRTPAFLADVTPAAAEWQPEYTSEPAVPGAFSLRSRKSKAGLFGSVWDFYSDWRSADGMGPIFIIDECHVGMPKVGTSSEVIEWYKLHRHFNVDVLLMTQNFRDVCPEIAGLLGMLVKVRKADILGRKDCYIRKVQSGYRGATISTDERKYQAQYFPLYKSHTQGSSLAEAGAPDVKPMIVGFNRMKWAVVALGVVGCAYAATLFRSKPLVPVSQPNRYSQAVTTPQGPSQPVAGGTLPPATVAPAGGVPPATPEPPASDMPDPYISKSIHMTGYASMGKKSIYTFAIAQNGHVVNTATDAEMVASGFTWKPTGHCTGVLVYEGKPRAVSCDMPSVEMAMGPRPGQPGSGVAPQIAAALTPHQ